MFDTITDVALPAGLGDLPPGPALAAALAGVDVGVLSGHDRVVVLGCHQRLASHYAARASADMAAIHAAIFAVDDDPESAFKAAAAEIRLALRLTRHTANVRLELALDLAGRLPAVGEAWMAGRIDERRAAIISAGTLHLDPEVARAVVELVVEEAPLLTTGELGARVGELCVVADPADASRRYAQAVEERRVVADPTPDGTAHLYGLDLPPHEAAAALDHVNRVARSLRRSGDGRSMDQLRADAFLDLLQGRTPQPTGGGGPAAGGMVELRVDLTTLAELDDLPGEVGGYGPVVADVARQVADTSPAAEWRYVVCHPDSGLPVHVGTTRRRPTATQRRQVEARSPRCVFPGCRVPASRCDLDHRQAWAQSGVTCTGCLEPLCRHDHRLRHLPGWMYQLQPDGDHLWTTRLGHTYTTTGRSP